MAFVKTGRYSRRLLPERETINVARDAALGVEDTGEFKAPEFDIGRVKELTQEQIAPTVSRIRRSVQRVQAGRSGTPTARGVEVREAIRGGGEAIGVAQAGATRTALDIYSPEYRAKLQEAILKFETTQAEKVREEERAITRGRRDPSSETYREAQARLDARVGTPRGVRTLTATTGPAAIDYTADLLR